MYLFNYKTLIAFCSIAASFIIACQPNPKTTDRQETDLSSQTSQKLLSDSLPQPTGYINDFEGIFRLNEIQSLDSLIKNFDKTTTIQIAVITLDTTMTTAENFDDFILRIAHHWGIGQKEKNNGIAIGLSAGYRLIRIQNGSGIENILSDKETKTIIDSSFIPYYKEGKYFEGTRNGINTLMTVLERRYK